MLSSVQLLAFGFTQLWMLGWMAAALAPLLIHLWNKRKYREMSWAAIDFLLAAMKKNARRMRLEQWVLLAVRTAIIVLVVLAVSGPVWNRLSARFAGGEPTHRVLVIDGSYSMAYRPADVSRFDRAKELATQIVEGSTQGDAFTLVLMSQPSRVVVGTPAFDPRDFLDEIQSLKLPHGGGDLAGALAQVDDIVRRARADFPRLTRTEVCFLTDLGRASWDAAAGSQASIARLADDVMLTLLDLGQVTRENVALTDLRCDEAWATIGRDLTLEASVQNFSSQPRRQPVELVVDDERIKEQFVDVPAGGQETIAFTHRFESAGDHTVEVRLLGDPLDIDNHRWLALSVKEFVEVLIVHGDNSEKSAQFLLFALNPKAGLAERAAVRAQVVGESALLELDLKPFDCLILSNVAQFTASEAQVLGNYLAGGGGVIFFLGDRVQPENYNRQLGGKLADGRRLLPMKLLAPADNSQYSFDPLGYRHPIVQVFEGNERAGLLTTPISRYFRVAPWPENELAAKTALAIRETGDPAIVVEPLGRGRVILNTLPASPLSQDPQTRTPWTLMPLWHSFPPLVHEMLAEAVRGMREGKNSEVGKPLSAVAPGGSIDASLVLRAPHERQEQLRLVDDAGKHRSLYADTWFSGIYRLTAGDGSSRSFAVNVDTTESDLAKLDPSELPSEIVARTEWQDLENQPAANLSPPEGLHRPLLYSVLALLLIETTLAWWFGYRSA